MRALRIALVVATSACGAPPSPARPVARTGVATAPVAAPVAKPAYELPDTPAGRQLAWMLGVLDARHGEVSRDEVEAHFDPSFLAKVPAIQVIAIASQLAPDFAGAHVVKVAGDGASLSARIASPTARHDATIAVGPSGAIVGLLFRPVLAESYDEVAALVAKLAPKVSLLVAELDGTTCKPLHAIAETQELAIASTFKLYILLALADQVMRGKLAWDQPIAVRDDWKSLPSGITQNDPAGTKLTIRTLADRMISISDNTATDHLLYTVGRKNVEAALHTAGHAQPLLDTPMLSTRELFLFRLGHTPEEVAKYVALRAAPRRAYLDGPLAKRAVTMDGAAAWKTARNIEELQWFASTMDLCGAMARLRERAAKVPAVLDVLAINPGLPLSPATWKYIGYKGGSEPGVLAGTWLLRRDDDKTFVVSLVANDPAGPEPDEKRVFGLANSVIELLAHEAR